MKSRGLVVAVAVVLAIVAAGAVYLYTSGVKEEAVRGGDITPVIVSSQDIPSNTNLNPLIEDGAFTTVNVPTDAVVAGAVTTTEELRNQTTTQPILANEQIPLSRLSGGEAVEGGALGISKGHVAQSTAVRNFEGVAGNIQRGDYVIVYVTFQPEVPIVKSALTQILTPAQLVKELAAFNAGSDATATDLQQAKIIRLDAPYTVTLVPGVRVLDIQNPAVDENTGRKGNDDITITLDLLPDDSQSMALVNSLVKQGAASVNLGLLPPEQQDGYTQPAVIGPKLAQVIGKE
jgi:Flp pilus assembly protein CpaB